MKVRPIRVAARRANELMCIIQNLEQQDVEWLDEDDVDIPKSDESEQIHNIEQQTSNVIENLESWIGYHGLKTVNWMELISIPKNQKKFVLFVILLNTLIEGFICLKKKIY